jgi:hypothetical protein
MRTVVIDQGKKKDVVNGELRGLSRKRIVNDEFSIRWRTQLWKCYLLFKRNELDATYPVCS